MKRRTPKQLRSEGFVLPQELKKSSNIPKKDRICASEMGSDGKWYYKIEKMSSSEKKIFEDAEKRKKAGKEILYQFDPIKLMRDLTIKVTKDKRGNVHVFIRQPKKGECHHEKCTNKVVKNYVLCKKHLKRKSK